MIITLISADIGQSDVDLGDRVLFSEVDEPPWPGPGVRGTRVCVHVIVDSQASIQICAHLSRSFVARQASGCKTRAHSPLRFASHFEVRLSVDIMSKNTPPKHFRKDRLRKVISPRNTSQSYRVWQNKFHKVQITISMQPFQIKLNRFYPNVSRVSVNKDYVSVLCSC